MLTPAVLRYGFLFFVLLWSSCAGRMSKESGMAALEAEIRQIVESRRATVGVAVIFDGRDTLTLNDDRQYPMLSVYKFHQALAVCDHLQQHGLSLSTPLYLEPRYFQPETYSPLRDRYPRGDTLLSVGELLTYTLQLSDSVACDILFDYVGGVGAVDRYIRSLGIGPVAIARTEEQMHRDPRSCYENWTSPRAAVELLEWFVNRADTGMNEYTDFIRRTMIECETGMDRLPAPFPKGDSVVIGHKTGTSDRDEHGVYAGTNDIGFVRLPDGRRYTIAVFVKDSRESPETNARIIAEISEAVYRYACGSSDRTIR